MARYTEVNYTIAMEADWNITHCPKGYAFVIKRPDSSVVCQLHNGLTPQDKALAQLLIYLQLQLQQSTQFEKLGKFKKYSN